MQVGAGVERRLQVVGAHGRRRRGGGGWRAGSSGELAVRRRRTRRTPTPSGPTAYVTWASRPASRTVARRPSPPGRQHRVDLDPVAAPPEAEQPLDHQPEGEAGAGGVDPPAALEGHLAGHQVGVALARRRGGRRRRRRRRSSSSCAAAAGPAAPGRSGPTGWPGRAPAAGRRRRRRGPAPRRSAGARGRTSGRSRDPRTCSPRRAGRSSSARRGRSPGGRRAGRRPARAGAARSVARWWRGGLGVEHVGGDRVHPRQDAVRQPGAGVARVDQRLGVAPARRRS